MKTRKLLVVDDDSEFLHSMQRFTQSRFAKSSVNKIALTSCRTYDQGMDILRSDSDFDIALIDFNLGGSKNGIEWIIEAKDEGFIKPCVLISNSSLDDIVDKKDIVETILNYNIRNILVKEQIRTASMLFYEIDRQFQDQQFALDALLENCAENLLTSKNRTYRALELFASSFEIVESYIDKKDESVLQNTIMHCRNIIWALQLGFAENYKLDKCIAEIEESRTNNLDEMIPKVAGRRRLVEIIVKLENEIVASDSSKSNRKYIEVLESRLRKGDFYPNTIVIILDSACKKLAQSNKHSTGTQIVNHFSGVFKDKRDFYSAAKLELNTSKHLFACGYKSEALQFIRAAGESAAATKDESFDHKIKNEIVGFVKCHQE